MPMMTSQILKFVNFTKTQKTRYLENETFFSSNKKIHKLHIKGYFIAKNSFVEEAAFKGLNGSYRFKIFKGCPLQILLHPFLNTLSQL